jgi:hypothetical protein
MATSRNKHPLQDSPFAEEFLEWMDSPVGQQYIGLSDELRTQMRDVQLDASGRRFAWPEVGRLTLDQSVDHIRKQRPSVAADQIRRFLISWIENYAPADYTDEQLNELDRLANAWVDELRHPSGRT